MIVCSQPLSTSRQALVIHLLKQVRKVINTLQIKNYKSIEELNLELGRVNVFIGENGCGKSNILEAIALAAAAASKKLDNEFLSSRGIRVTSAELMRSCFSESNTSNEIEISVNSDEAPKFIKYLLHNDNKPYSKWMSKSIPTINRETLKKYQATQLNLIKILENNKTQLESIINDEKKPKKNEAVKKASEISEILRHLEILTKDMSLRIKDSTRLSEFIIFSPENTALRNFYKEGQIEPLGINGEGLLKLLKVIQSSNREKLELITQQLILFSWFKDLKIPESISENDDSIYLTDKYINSKILDQRSANEGFLFLLFYITLFVADETSSFFAIDNIDASLNPKLCTKLMKIITILAKKFDKQVILTTHNPAILDGIDLNDAEQKLFVISRNRDGRTTSKEITAEKKPKSSTNEELNLSEAMLRGYLGGLPKGF